MRSSEGFHARESLKKVKREKAFKEKKKAMEVTSIAVGTKKKKQAWEVKVQHYRVD